MVRWMWFIVSPAGEECKFCEMGGGRMDPIEDDHEEEDEDEKLTRLKLVQGSPSLDKQRRLC